MKRNHLNCRGFFSAALSVLFLALVTSAQTVVPESPSSLSPQPLSAHQKFDVFLRYSYAPTNFLAAAASAGISQAAGSTSGYGQGASGYGKRFGAELAGSETGLFFSNFLLPTILHQDPRYFRRGTGGFFNRVWYAGTRALVTRRDDGSPALNTSVLMGTGISAGLTNLYYPDADRGAIQTLGRYGAQLGGVASFNVLREFWGDVRGKVPRRHHRQPASSDATQ
ncbi:MAG TPA: hypothetical protein VFA76_15965 [Terriglobales bacterium]|nr:hypothetical protein [Terriglobales bacterium]